MTKAFKTSRLYKMALEYIESPNPIEDREIGTIDITEDFYYEIEQMLINREHINININAPVRKGKSTVNIALGFHIQLLMIKLKISKEKFTIWNIARTQYELAMKMKSPKLNNCFICIDENDDLENTGENSTVEKALLENFSKVQAGRYIHRGYCSPSDMPDEGSDILLHVIQADKESMVTRCRLYYRVLKGTQKYTQLLGFVDINVSNVIKNWIENGIEELFYKKEKTKAEIALLDKWRQVDFYTDYMCKKFEKMDLINAKGIFRTKILDYSDIFLEAIIELLPLAKIKGAINNKIIRNTMQSLCKKHVIPTSIIGDKLMSDKVEGVLDLWISHHEQIERLKKMKKAYLKGGMPKEEWDLTRKALTEGIRKLGDLAEKEMKDLKEMSELKKRFYDTYKEDK